jgi:molecular chaperone DnaJ
MNQENFYNVLGVSETATQDEIKKVYRKLAVEHHPDKGGSEDKFKTIAEAYDTLGDEDKRKQYDNRRQNPFNGGFNPFEDLFGNSFYTSRKRAVPDKIIEMTIGSVDSYLGGDRVITYNREIQCVDCKGNGGDKVTCHVCNGQGFHIHKLGGSMFNQIVKQPCNNCKGSGQVYTKVCDTCNGKTTKTATESVKIKLPHGIDDGQFLKLQGKGDYIDGMYGNLVIRVKSVPQNNFEKMGNDLVFNSFLNREDMDKDSIEIPHPLGTISVKLPEIFDTSKPLRVKGKGFYDNGDMFVKLFVKFKRN